MKKEAPKTGKMLSRAGVSRRSFLQLVAMGGAAVIAPPMLANVNVQATPAVPRFKVKPFDLDEVTIAELQARMRSGKYSAASLVKRYLERIEQIDKRGPAVNAVIELNPDAMAIARALDGERKSQGPRGPLHGVPILIKDNIDTHDRMTTTAGSLALEGSVPPRDSFVAQRLRESGAVILGKTNLSEWANFRSTHSTSGWSGRGGLSRNPYALDRNPSGSSSGSAVAVATSLCAAAIGTETDGSIVSPCSANGIVGIKPTVGLVSRAGIVPIAHSQDTAGPMARTVTDAAILLGALAGADPRDDATKTSEGKSHRDYTKFLEPDGLRGARIGVARNFFGFHDQVDKLLEAAIEEMKGLGAVMVDPADIPTKGKFDDSEFAVLLYEFKADLKAYLESLGPDAPVRSLREIIEFNERNRPREMPCFGQEIFLKAQQKGPLTDKAYLDALEKNHQLARTDGIDAVINQHHLDAIVTPTAGPAWMTDLVNGDHESGGSSSPAAVAGYPSITVPAGQVSGLPVGLSFFGRAYSEPTLLKLAFAFEQAIRARQPPRFLLTADLRA